MNRAEFMEKLRELLSDIPENEREEALNYYEDYFDDAGSENEQSVIEELGSPEKVARAIKGEKAEEENPNLPAAEQAGKKGKMGTGAIILLVILAIFALPVLFPVVMSIFSVLFGLLVAAVGVIFAALMVGIGLVVGGAAVFGAAVVSLVASPAVSVLFVGISFVLVGIGILLTILGIWIVWKAVPPIIRWIVKIVRKPFERKEAQNG